MNSPQPLQESHVPWPVRYRENLMRFGAFSMALFCALIMARFIEVAGTVATAETPDDLWSVIGRAMLSDLLFFLKLMVYGLPVYLVLRLVIRNRNIEWWALGAIGTLYLAIHIVLVNYFFAARVPLGADLFGYSFTDIVFISRSGFHVSVLSVVSIVSPLVLFWVAWYFNNRVVMVKPAAFILTVGAGVFLILYDVSVLPRQTDFKNNFSYSLALNKQAFFISDTYAYLVGGTSRRGVNRHEVATKVSTPNERHRFLDERYPFLRVEDTPDVLGRYFTIHPETPPNIVIIAVEGLGRAFSGPNAYLESFTPFLDELTQKSLYWENFLAAQGRTFASLPSILGSLPYGDKGFNALGSKMPRHMTLFSILRHNGYRTRFYSGTNLNFDHQRAFLIRQQVDKMVGIDDFETRYDRLPDAYWGYADREVLQKAVDVQRADTHTPFVDYVQTVSMHTPYQVPGQEEYLRRFERRMEQLNFSVEQKEKYRKYREIYATILYTDAALRAYFEQQAKLPSYRNTIFVITGDHRLPEIPMSTKIDRYHVPLIIYSPLLKQAARFESISSHLDITPSLLAFLRHNYPVKTPDQVAWVGTGLDVNPAFRNTHSYPLKHTINNLVDYISGMYYLNEDTLFAIRPNMDLEPINDPATLSRLRHEFDWYKEKNDRFQRELKLIPDTVYVAFFSKR